jgi:hypothetical protein
MPTRTKSELKQKIEECKQLLHKMSDEYSKLEAIQYVDVSHVKGELLDKMNKVRSDLHFWEHMLTDNKEVYCY